MDVSVVIATWNNAKRLALSLDALSRCVVRPQLQWELVLVHTPSGLRGAARANDADETERIAKKFSDKLPLLYQEEAQLGHARAKNTGLEAASGQLIVFARR